MTPYDDTIQHLELLASKAVPKPEGRPMNDDQQRAHADAPTAHDHPARDWMDEFAPLPAVDQNGKVDVDALLRRETVETFVLGEEVHLACTRAYSRAGTPADKAHYRRLLELLAYRCATLWLLRAAQDGLPAAELPHLVWERLHDGGQFREWLWNWLTGYGIDPERVRSVAVSLADRTHKAEAERDRDQGW